MATPANSTVDPTATSIVFGPFRLSPMQRLLTEAGTPIHLGSRALDMLVALLERPGELVSKEELMAISWHCDARPVMDSEEAVTSSISQDAAIAS